MRHPTIADAAWSLRWWTSMTRFPCFWDCEICNARQLRVEAAALGLDMAVAWTVSGSRPRGQVLREIPA